MGCFVWVGSLRSEVDDISSVIVVALAGLPMLIEV